MKHFLPLLVVVMMAIPSLTFAIDPSDCINRYDINPINLQFGPITVLNSTRNDVLIEFGDTKIYTYRNSTREHGCFREEKSALCYQQYSSGYDYSIVFYFGDNRIDTVEMYPDGVPVPEYIECKERSRSSTHSINSGFTFGDSLEAAAQLLGTPTYQDDRIFIALFENEFDDAKLGGGTSYTAYIIEHILGKIQKVRISRHYTL